jgi:hypothetical protein
VRFFPGLVWLLSACATAGAQPDAGDSVDGAGLGASDAAFADGGVDAALATACTLALEGLEFDFESGPADFLHNRLPEVANSGTSWTFDHWEYGEPQGVACASGQKCWGTNLQGNYIQCGRAFLVTPPLDLSACATEGRDIRLSFSHFYDFWTGSWNSQTWFDGGLVEVSGDGESWTPVPLSYPGTIAINPSMGLTYSCVQNNQFYVDGKSGFVGSGGGWQTASAVIDGTLLGEELQVRFSYSSGVSSQTSSQTQSMNGTRPGWYIDDVSLSLP